MDARPRKNNERDDVTIHIGKRSAAGRYCHDCGTTLCREGTEHVHSGTSRFENECPSCGKTVTTGTCSFTWTLMKHLQTLRDLVANGVTDKVVRDEYGREYTAAESLAEFEGSRSTSSIRGSSPDTDPRPRQAPLKESDDIPLCYVLEFLLSRRTILNNPIR